MLHPNPVLKLSVKCLGSSVLGCGFLIWVCMLVGGTMDSTELAYIAFRVDRAPSRIYLIDVYRGVKILLAANAANANLAWSPDGTQLAYSVLHRGQPSIEVLNINSRSAYQLLNRDIRITSLKWSPDGQRLIVEAGQLYLVNVAEKQMIPFGRAVHGSSPTWSPDGQYVIFRESEGLYKIDAEGKNKQLLTKQVGLHLLSGSPDGQSIAFTIAPLSSSVGGLNILHLETGVIQPLTLNIGGLALGCIFSPDWSPDSKHLAFSGGCSGQPVGIYTVKTDGSDLRLLVGYSGGETIPANPAWRP